MSCSFVYFILFDVLYCQLQIVFNKCISHTGVCLLYYRFSCWLFSHGCTFILNSVYIMSVADCFHMDVNFILNSACCVSFWLFSHRCIFHDIFVIFCQFLIVFTWRYTSYCLLSCILSVADCFHMDVYKPWITFINIVKVRKLILIKELFIVVICYFFVWVFFQINCGC